MSAYIEAFNALAASQGSAYSIPDVTLWLPATQDCISSAPEAEQRVRKQLKDLGNMSMDLIGHCIQISALASQALCSAGIRHTFTVGNVVVDGVPYFDITPASLASAYAEGYIETKVINAHAWITLECGTVLDATILPSLAYRRHKKRLKLIQCIHRSDVPGPKSISHIPMILGPMFAVRTNWQRSEMAFSLAQQWIIAIDELLSARPNREVHSDVPATASRYQDRG